MNEGSGSNGQIDNLFFGNFEIELFLIAFLICRFCGLKQKLLMENWFRIWCDFDCFDNLVSFFVCLVLFRLKRCGYFHLIRC